MADDTILPSHQRFLIDQIMPEHEVHLLVGPSGAGKSTMAIQLFIKDYMAGNPIFNKPVHTRPIAYVSCDRSMASFLRAMDRHHLPYDSFPVIVLRKVPPVGHQSRIYSLLHWAKLQSAHLVIIDGFSSLIPDGKTSEYTPVANFLSECQDLAEFFDLTILGLVHSTKVKEHERITNPRQRILGSVAWAAYSDLIITVDREEPENPANTSRIVHVLPRDSEEFSIRLNQAPGGRLVSLDEEVEFDLHSILDVMLSKLPHDKEYKTHDLIILGFQEKISRPTIERWITSAVDNGRLERVRRGWYKRIPTA